MPELLVGLTRVALSRPLSTNGTYEKSLALHGKVTLTFDI
jgi:hypothetical protein